MNEEPSTRGYESVNRGGDDRATTRVPAPTRRLRAGVRAGSLVGPDDEEPTRRSRVEEWWV